MAFKHISGLSALLLQKRLELHNDYGRILSTPLHNHILSKKANIAVIKLYIQVRIFQIFTVDPAIVQFMSE